MNPWRFFIGREFPRRPPVPGLIIVVTLFSGVGLYPYPLAGQSHAVAALIDNENLIRVPVTLFGQIRYFIVDTGAAITCVDVRYESLLGAPERSAPVQFGTGGVSKTQLYAAPEILLGGMNVRIDTVACVDLALQRMILGEECDGILGIDALRRHVVVLDFKHRAFEITDRAPSGFREGKHVLPLQPSQTRFQINTAINGISPVALIVDSGSNSSLSLSPSDWDRVLNDSDREKVARVLLTSANNRVLESLMVRIRTLSLGEQDLPQLIAPRLPAGKASTLGLPVLRRHRVTFDFPGGRVMLEPQGVAQPEENDMSGLHLLKIGDTVTIHSIDDGSPAALAGLRANDVITHIDGRNVSNLGDIRHLLMTQDGDIRKVMVLRGAAELSVDFALKRIL